MAYLNFVIDLTQQPDGKYGITVQTSPVGEVRVVVESPFTPDEIGNALAVFGRSRQGITRLEEARAARQFGQRLFNFLIRQNDDVNAAYFASLDRAGTQGLRIRLSVEQAGALADLPWELLCDPNRDFLALSRSTPIVRYTQQLITRPPVPITMPLRVLVMISAPGDAPKLDVEGEWARLQAATADLQKRGMVQLERLDSATLIALQRRLRAEDYHVFHFVGHSAFDDVSQEGVLVFEQEQDEQRGQLISGASLARELGEESTIRLVVLNSCQSARRTAHDPFAGIASGIVQRGVPAVVAMQFPITDAAAAVFAEEFYRALSESLPIDSAISEARRAIANRLNNSEWATPVLYMRSQDGVLFRTVELPAVAPGRRLTLPLPILLVLAAFVVILGAVLYPVIFPPAPPPMTPTPTATVETGKPNLQVANIRSAPARPAPGQVFRLLISIRNTGDADTGAFNWTWDASPMLPNALEGRIDNIAPSAAQNISFPYSYGWWGAYSSQINVDIDGEVDESDERDNREAVIIQLDDASPFDIDFTLLPNNEIVSPPRPLGSADFMPWNLFFAADAVPSSDCALTPMQIIDLNDDTTLAPSGAAAPDCARLPMAITISRPVRNVAVEIVPTQDGQATLTFFGDTMGTIQLLQSPPQPLVAGEIVTLTADDDPQRRVRRVVVSALAQPINLTNLTLLPVPE